MNLINTLAIVQKSTANSDNMNIIIIIATIITIILVVVSVVNNKK